MKTCHKIIANYGAAILKKPKPNFKTSGMTLKEVNTYSNEYYKKICEHIQSNWQTFMDYFKTISINYKKKERINSYTMWWNECNLDGSFAYNGVTDDF